MAKTKISLTNQAKGLKLDLGTETIGDVSNLTLHVGSGSTDSVVLDSKGLIKVAGVEINPKGATEGQVMAFAGGKLVPSSHLDHFNTFETAADIPNNQFFLLHDEGLVNINGFFTPASSEWVTIDENKGYQKPIDGNVINLQEDDLFFKAQYSGKKMFTSLKSVLVPLSYLSDSATTYDDFFETTDSPFDYTKSKYVSELYDVNKSHFFFVVDDVNSDPEPLSDELVYGYYQTRRGDLGTKKVTLFKPQAGVYEPQYEGKDIVFFSNDFGRYNTYIYSKDMNGSGPFTYNDFLVDGVFTPSTPVLANPHRYLFVPNYTSPSIEGFGFNTLTIKYKIDGLIGKVANTLILRDDVIAPLGKTIYAGNLDLTDNIVMNGVKFEAKTLKNSIWVSSDGNDLTETYQDNNGEIFILGKYNSVQDGEEIIALGFGNDVVDCYDSTTIGDGNSIQESHDSFLIGLGNDMLESDYCFAIGESNDSTEGYESYTFGNSNYVGGDQNYVVGDGNDVSPMSDETAIVGHDNDIYDTAYNSYVFGEYNDIYGYTSNVIVIGHDNNIASGDTSYAFGEYNRIESSYDSIVIGHDNTIASGETSYAFGDYNRIESSYDSIVIGHNNTIASGDTSYAFGDNNRIESSHSVAIGYNNTIISPDSQSYAIGNNNSVTATNGFAIGAYHNVSAEGSVALGGSNIQAIEPNTVYVPNLVITGSIKNLEGGTPTVVTKGIDLIGEVDGVNTVFTFTEDVVGGTIMMYINGLLQSYKAGDDYTVDYGSKTITFSYAPDVMDKIIVYGTC
jgi:hypothetical protein